MRLQFVTIGQNLNWPRGRLSLARKKKYLALARVKNKLMHIYFKLYRNNATAYTNTLCDKILIYLFAVTS